MRKRTVRKVYDLINPITHAMYQASRLTTAEWNKQMVPVIAAVDLLTKGQWKPDNWQPLFECLNRIESLTKLNNVDASEFINDAQKAMVDALDRKQTIGATAFKASELEVVREVVNVYGDLLKEATHLQFSKACAHTNANVARILRNKKKMHQSAGCVFERAAC